MGFALQFVLLCVVLVTSGRLLLLVKKKVLRTFNLNFHLVIYLRGILGFD